MKYMYVNIYICIYVYKVHIYIYIFICTKGYVLIMSSPTVFFSAAPWYIHSYLHVCLFIFLHVSRGSNHKVKNPEGASTCRLDPFAPIAAKAGHYIAAGSWKTPRIRTPHAHWTSLYVSGHDPWCPMVITAVRIKNRDSRCARPSNLAHADRSVTGIYN